MELFIVQISVLVATIQMSYRVFCFMLYNKIKVCKTLKSVVRKVF